MRTLISAGSALALALSAVALSGAAPQAYVIRGQWTQANDPFLNAQVGAPFQGVFIYDPQALNITNNPDFGTLGNVDAGQTTATQQIYAFESPSELYPGLLPKGPNGWNYIESGGTFFPRAQVDSMGGPQRPAIAKVLNDGAGPFGPPFWDVIEFVDHMNLTQTGGGGAHRLSLSFIDFTSNGMSISSLNLPSTIDLDDFQPFQPWGISIRGNLGLVIPGSPTGDDIEQIPFGDANLDGRVTGADYTVWADNFGMAAGTALWIHGDFNVDGQVSGADYTIWADNFGADMADGPVAAVPEPHALALALAAGLGMLLAGRRARRLEV